MPAPPNFTNESTIRRDAQGRWFHDELPVTNEAVARAFDRWIDRADDGRYIVKNAVNWVYVSIEGAPLFVVGLAVDSAQVTLELNDGAHEAADLETLCQDSNGTLYIGVRQRRLPAQFARKVQQQLAPLVAEDEDGIYLDLLGQRIRPPIVTEPMTYAILGGVRQ